MVALVRHYHSLLAPDCEIFMSMLLRQLEHESSLAHRVLALEAIKSFTASPELLYFFYRLLEESPDSSKVFGSLAHALSRVVMHAQSRLGLDETALVHAMWSHASASSAQAAAAAPTVAASSSGGGSGLGGLTAASVLSSVGNLLTTGSTKLAVAARGRGLDLLSEREAPNFDELHPVALAHDALRAIVTSLQALAQRCDGQQLTALQTRNDSVDERGAKGASVRAAIAVPEAAVQVCFSVESR